MPWASESGKYCIDEKAQCRRQHRSPDRQHDPPAHIAPHASSMKHHQLMAVFLILCKESCRRKNCDKRQQQLGQAILQRHQHKIKKVAGRKIAQRLFPENMRIHVGIQHGEHAKKYRKPETWILPNSNHFAHDRPPINRLPRPSWHPPRTSCGQPPADSDECRLASVHQHFQGSLSAQN